MQCQCLYIFGITGKGKALCFMHATTSSEHLQWHVHRIKFQPITKSRAGQQITTKLLLKSLCKSSICLKPGFLSRRSGSQNFLSVVKTRTVFCFFLTGSNNGDIVPDNKIIWKSLSICCFMFFAKILVALHSCCYCSGNIWLYSWYSLILWFWQAVVLASFLVDRLQFWKCACILVNRICDNSFAFCVLTASHKQVLSVPPF